MIWVIQNGITAKCSEDCDVRGMISIWLLGCEKRCTIWILGCNMGYAIYHQLM